MAPTYATARVQAGPVGISALVLEGASCGILRKVSGGAIAADVVSEAVGPGHVAKKHLGPLRYEDFELDIGFAMGTNIYFQGPNPDGSQTADGYYHPEDETFLPWFMRLAPNYISEPTQSPSTNIGRYTFMGDLNQFPGFQQPATGCH